MVALLVSEACNIGLAPVVNPGCEALTRARLVHNQHYLRADTIAAANAPLIAAQADIPIVRHWGEGLLASVDGLRFQVPVRTINAAPSPKCFGFKRGITWLNAVNDQVAGIGQMVVPGTPRDSLHILDALLNLDGGVKPEMVATDNASYSDMVFGGACSRSSATTSAHRNRVNLNKVITHWPDMLKVAGSLVTNQVHAYDLLRMFGRDGRPTPIGAASAEYGRIAKTEHLLRVVDRWTTPTAARCTGSSPCRSPATSSRRRVPRQARHHPPGVPRGDGGPARRARPGPQRHGALDNPLH
ncbi:Tn3 family transposase [Streptomyces sp. NPDC088731]|uniref:Tn3 family transposase n=1 Tax=Streptomyces sp. NPDC088731 TaxID=3365878 RepID=UPI0037F3F89A